MPTKPDRAADSAETWLAALGYRTTRVPAATTKTCDIRAAHSTGTLWVECKRDRLATNDEKRLAAGESIVIRDRLESHRKTLDHLARATEQLRASAPMADLKFIWIDTDRAGSVSAAARVHCTLYGVRWFKILSGPNRTCANLVPVYLGGRSAFQRSPDISAAVIKSRGRMGLHVNPFTASFAQLGASHLFKMIQKCGGVFHLAAAAHLPEIYSASPDVAGAGESAVKSDLMARYGIEAVPTALATDFSCSGMYEQGQMPTVPGAEVSALDLNVLLLAESRTATV